MNTACTVYLKSFYTKYILKNGVGLQHWVTVITTKQNMQNMYPLYPYWCLLCIYKRRRNVNELWTLVYHGYFKLPPPRPSLPIQIKKIDWEMNRAKLSS